MVNGIGGSGAGRAAIEAALKQMRARSQELGAKPAETASEPTFTDALKESLSTVEAQVDKTNTLERDVVEGRLDIHEVAAQIKESEITFQFALQVRNKLLDAYREVMRMSV